jgi:hypothetical protein
MKKRSMGRIRTRWDTTTAAATKPRPEGGKMPRFLATFSATIVVLIAAATSASAAPTPIPGEPGCAGRDTANFAQDWKTFSFEPSGVARLVRFYGGTNPTDWLQSERYADCTPA